MNMGLIFLNNVILLTFSEKIKDDSVKEKYYNVRTVYIMFMILHPMSTLFKFFTFTK